MLKSLKIIATLILIALSAGCAGKCVNTLPEFPVPSERVLDAVEASPSAELQEWFFIDLQRYWDQVDSRNNDL